MGKYLLTDLGWAAWKNNWLNVMECVDLAEISPSAMTLIQIFFLSSGPTESISHIIEVVRVQKIMKKLAFHEILKVFCKIYNNCQCNLLKLSIKFCRTSFSLD